MPLHPDAFDALSILFFDKRVGVDIYCAPVAMRSFWVPLAGIELLSKHLKNYENF
jgi:hypothetical protein